MESCGCAQYTQPLPAGAEYCNYKKNPNWSKCWDTPTPCQPQSPQHSTALPVPGTHTAGGKGDL